jgi:hypothetical protein
MKENQTKPGNSDLSKGIFTVIVKFFKELTNVKQMKKKIKENQTFQKSFLPVKTFRVLEIVK